jgi:hypothetical protein
MRELHHKFLVIEASEADIAIQQRDNSNPRAVGPATRLRGTPGVDVDRACSMKNGMKTKELLMSALIVALARLARAAAIRGKAQVAIKLI